MLPQAALAAEVTICSYSGLVEAISSASTDETITFDCDPGTVITFDAEIAIDTSLTIDGALGENEQITFDGNESTRLFTIAEGVNVTLQNVVVQNGSFPGDGGAILNNGTLTIEQSTFDGNATEDVFVPRDNGGAIYNAGVLTVNQSLFTNNTTADDGGAIHNEAGTLKINQSKFVNNTAPLHGGGGAINIRGGEVKINQSSFIDNSTPWYGGAIFNGQGGPNGDQPASLTVVESRFQHNTSHLDGAAIYSHAELIIDRSSFINNQSDRTGGAIDAFTGSLKVTSSTFVGNTAVGDSATGTGSAVAVGVGSGSASIAWSTIVQPGGTSPALYVDGDLTITGVLLGGSGDHCTFDFGSEGLLTATMSLTNDDSCVPDTTAGWENQSLQLGELQTMTMSYGIDQSYYPLTESSPAVGAGGPVCPTPDQLGAGRPQQGACDIGAIESPFIAADPVDLCANRWTGALRMPASSRCASTETLLSLPDDSPLTLCANRWTGEARYSQDGRCRSTETSYVADGSDSIPVCVNRWTSELRIDTRCTNTEWSDQL